jgi:hypothetical protein
MITDHIQHSPDAIRPEDLAMLQRVFDGACASSEIAKGTNRAEGLAATLFRLFQEGVRDEDELDKLLAQIELT